MVYTCDICVNVCVAHSLSVMMKLLSLCELIIGICICNDLNYEPYELNTMIHKLLLNIIMCVP